MPFEIWTSAAASRRTWCNMTSAAESHFVMNQYRFGWTGLNSLNQTDPLK
jgi:hypothetical protein